MLDVQQSEFINTKSLASYLSVSPMTIVRMRRTGRLPLPCYADQSVTLWATRDLVEWEQNGRPVLLDLALDAGEDLCASADTAIREDRNRPAWDSQAAAATAAMRTALAEMRRATAVCERILNSSPHFVKQPAEMQLDRREAALTKGSDE